MKVKLLPLAIGAAIAMPGVALAEGPTFYGKIDVAYGMSDVDYAYDVDLDAPLVPVDPNSADTWTLESYDSRFGVKGSEKINDSLDVIYQIEWTVAMDDGSMDMGHRDRFVGLKGGFGTFKVGKFDSPLKKAQGKIDQFGDRTGDIKYVFTGENRVSNILQYSSPSMGGVQINAAFMPGEEDEVNDGGDANDGPADAISLSVTFSMDNVYAALAHDSEVSGYMYTNVDTDLGLDRDFANLDTTRLVGVFNMDAFEVGAMYQVAEASDTDIDGDIEQDGFLVSGAFKINSVKLKAQVGMSTYSDNDADVETDVELIALGADYKLSKQTNFFGHFTTLSFEGDWDGSEEQTADRLEVGIIHKF